MERSKILAHRGCWTCANEQNTSSALHKALSNGFGLETDLRDYNGELIISHDPPRSSNNMRCIDLFHMVYVNKFRGRLALNIKSDGLHGFVGEIQKKFTSVSSQSFVFDMSVPDMLGYDRRGIQFYSRISDIEPSIPLQGKAEGIWVDNFGGDFDQVGTAAALIERGLMVALVSPELHGRDYLPVWIEVKKAGLHLHDAFEICTDHPFDALNFFSGC